MLCWTSLQLRGRGHNAPADRGEFRCPSDDGQGFRVCQRLSFLVGNLENTLIMKPTSITSLGQKELTFGNCVDETCKGERTQESARLSRR